MSAIRPDSAVTPVDATNFEAEVTNSPIPVLIDVSTGWCPPCRIARPIVEELSRTHRGELKVVEIDGDASPELAARLGVRGFPTFLGVVRGEVVERRVGFAGKKPLEGLASALLRANSETRKGSIVAR